MYLEGKSIQEIAEERELKSITVEAHLESCARLGYDIDFRDFVSEEKEEIIIKTYKGIGGDKLKPIKEALPPHITYTEIKFALCKLQTGEEE